MCTKYSEPTFNDACLRSCCTCFECLDDKSRSLPETEVLKYIDEQGIPGSCPKSHQDILELFHYVQATDGVFISKCDLKFYEAGTWPK